MRVLFTTWAWPSHLYALVPLAWACRAAGHEVLVASQPGLAGELARTGLPAQTVGGDVDAVAMVRGYALPSADDEGGQAPRTGRGPRAMRMFLAHAESMVDGLVELAADWRADLVLFEPTALAGPVAAAAVGVPAVRQLYGTDLLLRARSLLPELLAPLAERHGAGAFDPFGAVTVDPTPPSLQVPADHRRLPMRYVPFNGPGRRPAELPAPQGRPRVCVTWGHTMARLSPRKFLLPTVVDAVSDLDVDLVAAVSADQVDLLGPMPARVRVVVDAPLHQVLPGYDLVVAHGGAGTVLTAVHHGVPLLLVPQLPDHTGHAARVVATGAGEVLTRDEASPARLREEVLRLVADGPERRAVQALRREMHQQPAPAALVAELERVAETVAAQRV
jgi:UDP:flavonoid glycosyltransferase YjiC (YdhE family)